MNTEIEKTEGQEIIKRKDIQGTPFTIVTTEGKSFLTMGRFQISEPMEEEEIAIYMIENEFNIITTMIGIIAEAIIKTQQKAKSSI